MCHGGLPYDVAMQARIDFRHLRYFIAVSEEESFVRAATRLNIAQPAISRQIKSLEEDLGVDLLNRNSKGVTLTQSGTIFLAEARKMIDGLEMMIIKTQKAAGPTESHCIIGACSDPLAMKTISRRLCDFTGSGTQLLMRPREETKRMAAEGTIDFFVDLKAEDTASAFLSFDLFSDKAVLAIPEKAQSIEELRRIIVPSLYAQHESLLMQELGYDAQKVIVADDWACALALVTAGRGVTIVPASWTSLGFEQIRLESTKKDLAFTYQIFFSPLNDSTEFAQLVRWLGKA